MKKRIAVFANGWTTENLINFMKGLRESLKEFPSDLYMFLSYGSYGQSEMDLRSESMTYRLPDLTAFDAAVIFGCGLNFRQDIDYIYSTVDNANIPAISIGLEHPGHIHIFTDNTVGMYSLCNHIIEKHGAKDIAFIGGSADNEDSNTRLRVLRECMDSHGLALNDSDIYYSNWEISQVKIAVENILNDREKLPEAIVCANDLIATHVSLFLSERNYSVPQDAIVTGFDNLSESQTYYPSIASVDQNYPKLGSIAGDSLIKIFNGDKVDSSISISSEFIPGESCGCNDFRNSDALRRELAHKRPYAVQREYGISGRLYTFEHAIMRSGEYKELSGNLKPMLAQSTGSEGSTFYIMMDPLFADLGKDVTLPEFKYSDEFDVVSGKNLGVLSTAKKVSRAQLIPDIDPEGENRIYMIGQLHLDSFACGYLVFADDLKMLDENSLFMFVNRTNRILVILKRNMQLTELNNKLSALMEQDALTKVKNRTAYEKYIRNLERDFNEGENKPFAVIFFDINDLKAVNDRHGHEKGDAYIKNSCRLICNTFKHSPVFRIGGDEFVTIAQNDDYDKRHELMAFMREHMEALKTRGDSVPLTERISIASGMAEYDRTLDEDFASIFKRADELMYENKYNMKNPKA
ncbi:MAG: diguanylate cyclase [Lachnospiraceae bacterium]|nr:diguanylate cyclase [Lachnospiraceae bacterium]